MNIKQIQQEPCIDVGIMTEKEIAFTLHQAACVELYASDKSRCHDRVLMPDGNYRICYDAEGKASLYDDKLEQALLKGARRYRFIPLESKGKDNTEKEEAFFSLQAVRIGIDFHWDRCQKQSFVGELHFLVDAAHQAVIAINRIELEDYLLSVIASEMSAKAGLELLRAHAIISRSWLLAQGLGKHLQADKAQPINKTQPSNKTAASTSPTCGYDNETEHIRWYERDAHQLFDVCADDHCQRYQGFQQATTPQVRQALASTRGMVIACEEEICDARFYKCCGGKTEVFEAAWAEQPKAYLQSVNDCPKTTSHSNNSASDAGHTSASDFEHLSDEAQARAFICASPEAFCHTNDPAILQQVLNDYDQETSDFYRWEQRYSAEELSAIVRERSGIDFGRITALIPIERSYSGRLVKLKIVGDKRSLIVGKELEIRKFLSRTHLYSSAFVVDEERKHQGEVETFILKGAGWGHGVGLCQIGAAVMSHQGYSYQEILRHYYPNTDIVRLY